MINSLTVKKKSDAALEIKAVTGTPDSTAMAVVASRRFLLAAMFKEAGYRVLYIWESDWMATKTNATLSIGDVLREL